MNFGENIKTYRQKLGYSQQDLADILNVSKAAISHWENNIRVPKFPVIEKLLNIFHISFDDFIDVDTLSLISKNALDETIINVYKHKSNKNIDIRYLKEKDKDAILNALDYYIKNLLRAM